jgi:hypothetical protein
VVEPEPLTTASRFARNRAAQAGSRQGGNRVTTRHSLRAHQVAERRCQLGRGLAPLTTLSSRRRLIRSADILRLVPAEVKHER